METTIILKLYTGKNTKSEKIVYDIMTNIYTELNNRYSDKINIILQDSEKDLTQDGQNIIVSFTSFTNPTTKGGGCFYTKENKGCENIAKTLLTNMSKKNLLTTNRGLLPMATDKRLVLLELAYLTNKTDFKMIQCKSYLKKVTDSLIESLYIILGEKEENTTT
jgi:N-acetylmuramoyl-L-alanine amidase